MVELSKPRKSCLKKDGKKAAKNGKKVGFSTLEITSYLIEIGDNPSCEGAPLCIGNEIQGYEEHEVNEYEASRKPRRHRKQLALSPSKRSRILMTLGYSMEDIAIAALETQKARQEREETIGNQKWDKFKFVFESANRKIKKIVSTTKPRPTRASMVAKQA